MQNIIILKPLKEQLKPRANTTRNIIFILQILNANVMRLLLSLRAVTTQTFAHEKRRNKEKKKKESTRIDDKGS